MAEWWRGDWLPRHVLFAPFGVFLVTALLVWWSVLTPWQKQEVLEAAAKYVDLAAVLYGMAAVAVEKGGRLMFWALDQRRQWREKWRQEIVAETEERMEAETEERVRQAKARQEETIKHLERVAHERGIPLEELLPPELER